MCSAETLSARECLGSERLGHAVREQLVSGTSSDALYFPPCIGCSFFERQDLLHYYLSRCSKPRRNSPLHRMSFPLASWEGVLDLGTRIASPSPVNPDSHANGATIKESERHVFHETRPWRIHVSGNPEPQRSSQLTLAASWPFSVLRCDAAEMFASAAAALSPLCWRPISAPRHWFGPPVRMGRTLISHDVSEGSSTGLQPLILAVEVRG